MPIEINTLGETFAGEVRGLDMSQPVPDDEFARIRDAFHRHAVLVFRDVHPDDESQIAFSRRLGELEKTVSKNLNAPPEIANLSNVGPDDQILPLTDKRSVYIKGNLRWHTDSSFKKVPAAASLLSAREVPETGGETEWADMRAAYDALPEATKQRIDGLTAEHSFVYSLGLINATMLTNEEKAAVPPVPQPLVRTHPVTGRKALYIGIHASHVIGLPRDEGRALLDELLEHATAPRFVYRHHWHPGDAVLWDNRCTLHRGMAWNAANQRRIMRRTTVAGDAPFI